MGESSLEPGREDVGQNGKQSEDSESIDIGPDVGGGYQDRW